MSVWGGELRRGGGPEISLGYRAFDRDAGVVGLGWSWGVLFNRRVKKVVGADGKELEISFSKPRLPARLFVQAQLDTRADWGVTLGLEL